MASAKRKEEQEAPAEKSSKRIRLTAPHGYYTDANDLKFWQDGQIVEGEEADHLIERKALHEELK